MVPSLQPPSLNTSQHHDISNRTTRCRPSYAFGLRRANPRASAPSLHHGQYSLGLFLSNPSNWPPINTTNAMTMRQRDVDDDGDNGNGDNDAATHGTATMLRTKNATTPVTTATTTTVKKTADGGDANDDNDNDDVFDDDNPTRMMGSQWAASGR